MYRILAIGNSFSEDASFFLHEILENSGVENEVINLYIGGCSLERHWRNIEGNLREYQFQKNGRKTDRFVSVSEILQEQSFDAIITQQASGDSGWKDTYEPFLGLITEYLRSHTTAKLYLNETWAYEKNSRHEHFMRYHRDQQEMFHALKKAYEAAAKREKLSLIRTGEVIQKIRELPAFRDGTHCITRDGFHMDYVYGRYAVALMWAKNIAEIDVLDNSYLPEIDFMPCEKTDDSIVNQIRKIVKEL